MTVYCDYCGHKAALVDDSEIYGRSFGHTAYLCRNCGAYVGCHGRTDKPLGRLADATLRKWKMAAHASFDPLWKTGPFRGRQVTVAGRVKTMNESVYYSVDLLHEAIQKNSRITFRYFDYNLDGSRRYRPGLYAASPYALCWQDENYYLVAHSERHGLTHYRVDKMASISMTGEPRYMDAQTRELDLSEYGKNVFGMFAGSREQLRLRFDRSLTGVVIDRFGRGTPCVPDGPDKFICTVEVAVSPNFFGWLASFGARAELLSPASVREAFVALCRAAEAANS